MGLDEVRAGAGSSLDVDHRARSLNTHVMFRLPQGPVADAQVGDTANIEFWGAEAFRCVVQGETLTEVIHAYESGQLSLYGDR